MEEKRSEMASGLHLSPRVKNALWTALMAALAFAIPFLVLILLFASNSFYPFAPEGTTMIMIDAQSQYVAFFRYFKYVLMGEESWVYTLSKTYGGNFMSLYAFYLGSPFNLLLPLINDADIPTFMLFTSLVKMALAGLFFYLLLRFKSGHDQLIYLLFSTAYALCSYSFVYLCNLMWLDAVMILPLVALGIYQIAVNKQFLVYPLALAYALVSSWYTGFMVAVFSVLFFLVVFFAQGREHWKWRPVLSFGAMSLAGGFLAAFSWLAAFLHFAGTKAGGGMSLPSWDEFNSLTVVLEGFLTNHYVGTSSISRYGGFATYFVSTPVLVFLLMYFGNKSHSWRERLLDLALLAFYLLAIWNKALDTLMHGGSVPTWFPARYSFVIAFFACYVAAKEGEKLKETSYLGLAIPAVALPVVLLIVALNENDMGNLYEYSVPGLVVYLLTWAFAVAAVVFSKMKPAIAKNIVTTASLAALLMGIYSSALGGDRVLTANVESGALQTQMEYLADDAFQSDVDLIKSHDDSLYRMENTFLRDGSYNGNDNDPMFYRFPGVSHFSSTENKELMSYARKIGFYYNGFTEGFDGGSTLAMNSYLGIKYLLDDGNGPAFLSSLTNLDFPSQNGTLFYENQYVLPMAFLTERTGSYFVNEGVRFDEETIRWFDHFQYQNEIYKTMNGSVVDAEGNREDIFKPLVITGISTNGLTYEVDKLGDYYVSGPSGSSITFSFIVPEEAYDDNLYVFLKDINDDLRTYVDGRYVEMLSYWHNGIRSLEDNATHAHTLRVSLTASADRLRVSPELYYEDLDVLSRYAEAIKEGGSLDLKLEGGSGFAAKGTIDVTASDKALLFTIPYEDGMAIYVDGKKMETERKFNIFTSCNLDGVSLGKHEIEIRYQDNGLVYGAILSFLGIAGIAGYGFYFYWSKKKPKRDGHDEAKPEETPPE